MRFGVVLFSILFLLQLHAQERCGSKAPTSGEFESWISTKIAERRHQPLSSQGTHAPVYRIPVVVHVFHKGEPIGTGTNLSEERIKAQIDSLTADFRRTNADRVNTPAVFGAVAADVEIEFVLAKQDPAGNPTNGIIRIRGSKNSYRARANQPLIRSESYWPSEHYLNIFVMNLESLIGLAAFPRISISGIFNDFDDFIFDGVLVDYEYFGVNPDAPAFESRGRTLTHEVGHYLGLRHIWGDGGCSADDFVSDTPLADDDNGKYTSPCTFPNPDDTRVCETGKPEMFQNYMDYTDDICMNLFTIGQKMRMRTVMENAPSRTSLISSPALNDPVRFLNDLAIVEILSPNDATCSNSIVPDVRVTNFGTNDITSYEIQLLIDGNPVGSPKIISSTLIPLASDTITFSAQTISSTPSTIGFQINSVNATTDGQASNNNLSISLSATSSGNLPFEENFESTPKILGKYGSAFPWQATNAPKNTPTNQACVFKAYNNTEWHGEETILKTPVFDLTGLPSGELHFSYAHANQTGSFYDGLMVKASSDCGETFPDVLFYSFGTRLASASPTSASFIPANQLEWTDTVLSITKYKDLDGVQFAFVGMNGGGNNIYLDDIEILETNLLKNDIKPTALNSPLITCSTSSKLQLEVRNVGSENINSFEVVYSVNGVSNTTLFQELDIPSKEYATFSLAVDSLFEGANKSVVEIVKVNGVADTSATDNVIETSLKRDNKTDDYPLLVDFDHQDEWVITTTASDTLWERAAIAENKVLRANGFSATNLGKQHWFVSPRLSTGGLDSAGLYFRVSYASRVGFNDQLQVLLSTNCGESYPTTLLDADSDSLAISTTNALWQPTEENQWKSFRLNLPHAFSNDEAIRIAFVFTPGGGNDLYIDDIRIQGNEPPSYQDVFLIFPNPATSTVNVGLNLPVKQAVTIKLIDMSGRIVFEDNVPNAFNQILNYQPRLLGGLYFLTVEGSKFSSTQKLFINR